MSRFNLLISLCISCLFSIACTSSTPPSVDCQQPPLLMKSDKPEQSQLRINKKRQNFRPRGDLKLATVETIKINRLESSPVQVNIEVTGSLPSACYRVRETRNTRNDNYFSVLLNLQALQTYLPCEEKPVPFSTIVPLNVQGLDAGGYCVEVNGVTDSFVLSADN